jgi:diguanylate cyclase (GGDEF)-like protein
LAEFKTEAPAEAGTERAGTDLPISRKGRIWLMQAAGAGLLIAGWAYFALPHFGSAQFFLDSLVFCVFGTYAFIAAYNARRETVALEKKLRYSLIRRNMELESMTTRDDLTHLFSRRHFFDRFERELQTARAAGRALSVLLIDLKGMEQINTKHGHTVGDKVLAAFGRFLADHARGSDVPARIDGDEFAVLMPAADERAADAAVTRIVTALEKSPLFEQHDVSLTVSASVGRSGYPWGAGGLDEIMHNARESMSAHKREQCAVVASSRERPDGRRSRLRPGS